MSIIFEWRPNHQSVVKSPQNLDLDLVYRKMTQGPFSLANFKAELYLFAGVSTYFILPIWKTTSKLPTTLLNKINIIKNT